MFPAEDTETRPPINVKFEIPYFTTSGIQVPHPMLAPPCLTRGAQVRYLKIIEKSGYQALPWVRYISQSGEYCFRLST